MLKKGLVLGNFIGNQRDQKERWQQAVKDVLSVFVDFIIGECAGVSVTL
jgi:hypothetical protein